MSLAAGAARAWRAYEGESIGRARPRIFLNAFRRAFSDVVAQRKLSDCDEHRGHRYAHLAVFYGFLILAGLAGVAAILLVAGGPYPLSAGHPLKILGNLASAMLILGSGYFACERWIATKQGDPSTYFDWVLLGNLLTVGITGVLCEVFRFQDAPLAAYPTYFLHLVSVFLLLVLLPYTKLAHLCYRLVALTSREYEALLRVESPETGSPRPVGTQPFHWPAASCDADENAFDHPAPAAALTQHGMPGE